MSYTLQNFGQHVLTNFGLAQAVGKNSSKDGKLGNRWPKVEGTDHLMGWRFDNRFKVSPGCFSTPPPKN